MTHIFAAFEEHHSDHFQWADISLWCPHKNQIWIQKDVKRQKKKTLTAWEVKTEEAHFTRTQRDGGKYAGKLRNKHHAYTHWILRRTEDSVCPAHLKPVQLPHIQLCVKTSAVDSINQRGTGVLRCVLHPACLSYLLTNSVLIISTATPRH